MSTRTHPPARSSLVHRYGPLGSILVVGVVIAGLLVARRDLVPTNPGGLVVAPAATASRRPVLYDEAKAAGLDLARYGERCDPATGRIRMPTIYAPPCVPVHDPAEGAPADTDPGTVRGVTDDTIRIVEYVASPVGDLTSVLRGKVDDRDAVARTTRDVVDMLSHLFERHGRRIELVSYEATGAANDEVAAKADAVDVAETIGAFASLGGPALAPGYAYELSARGVLCIDCGVALSDLKIQDNTPHIWGRLASPEEYLLQLQDLIEMHLSGKPASFAGDPALQRTRRRFGVVHFEQEVPVFAHLDEEQAEIARSKGEEIAATETYTLDPGNLAKLAERAQTIVAKLKGAGVTSVIFAGDPLMPGYLTRAATEQQYFPEWIITGTVYTDTALFARTYDQRQWAHAFGLSSQPARRAAHLTDAWALHQWWFGRPPEAARTASLVYQPLELLFLGIHLAGRHLTPETFRDGLFRYPPTGGGPTTPHVSFGRHGYFIDADGTERTDHLAVDDMTLIWWDAETEGPDESDTVGRGVYRYLDGGRRYLPRTMTPGDLAIGDRDRSVVRYDELPPEDRAPSYPPPPDAPAARANR